MGARKFIVFEIAPLGCLPYILDKVRPKTRCAENINRMVSIYNEFLAVELQKMKSTLEGSNFVTGKTYMLTYDMIKRSSRYGKSFRLTSRLATFLVFIETSLG